MAKTVSISENSTIQNLIDNTDNPLEADDTIELTNCELIIDKKYDDTPIYISTKSKGKIKLENGSRLIIKSGIPINVELYVDPNNPLPARNTEAGLTANAAAEIYHQYAGKQNTIYGSYSCPTEKLGQGWGLITSAETTEDSTILVFDRNIDVEQNDYIFPILSDNYSHNIQVVANVEHNSDSCIVTINSVIDYGLAANSCWCVMAGGVLIHRDDENYNMSFNTGSIQGGILNLYGGNYGVRAHGGLDRLVCHCNTLGTAFTAIEQPFYDSFSSNLLMSDGSILFLQAVTSGNQSVLLNINEVVINSIFTGNQNNNPNICINGGYMLYALNSCKNNIGLFEISNSIIVNNVSFNQSACSNSAKIIIKNSTINNTHVDYIELSPNSAITYCDKSSLPENSNVTNAYYFYPLMSTGEVWKSIFKKSVKNNQILNLTLNSYIASGSEIKLVLVPLNSKLIGFNCSGNNYRLFTGIDSAINTGVVYAYKIISEDEGTQPNTWKTQNLVWKNTTGFDKDVECFVVVGGSTLDGAYLNVSETIGSIM